MISSPEPRKVTLEFTAEEITLLMNAAALGVAVITNERAVVLPAIAATLDAFADDDVDWNALGDRIKTAVAATFPEQIETETVYGERIVA